LAAHLCRCTGWLGVYDAIASAASGRATAPRDLARASERAALEGGVPQDVGREVVLGAHPFADDEAPRDALVAVPCPPESPSQADSVEAAGLRWVVGESLLDARTRAQKVQGRRTSAADESPFALPPCPD